MPDFRTTPYPSPLPTPYGSGLSGPLETNSPYGSGITSPRPLPLPTPTWTANDWRPPSRHETHTEPTFGSQLFNWISGTASSAYNAVSSRVAQVPTVASMFFDWISGSGPAHRDFGEESLESQDMQDAWRVNQARDYFYKKNEGVPCTDWVPVTNYSGSFGLEGLARAGLDPTEQFVGSYSIDITPQADCSLDFELNNTTSMKSFLYGVGPAYDRSTFSLGGNMTQTYSWNEPSRIED